MSFLPGTGGPGQTHPSAPSQAPWGKAADNSQRSGGVIVMDWAVNSSSKYLVSTSEVT